MTSKPDKLYRVWNSTLEIATFMKEQILEGATKPTWTVRCQDGSKAITSTEYWELTELAAWKKYERELKECGPGLVRAIKEAQASFDQCTADLIQIAAKIERLTT